MIITAAWAAWIINPYPPIHTQAKAHREVGFFLLYFIDMKAPIDGNIKTLCFNGEKDATLGTLLL